MWNTTEDYQEYGWSLVTSLENEQGVKKMVWIMSQFCCGKRQESMSDVL